MGFLSDLVERRRRELRAAPLDEGALLQRAAARPPARDLTSALRPALGAREPAPAPGLAVIAEVKRASPSAGAIAPAADPATQAAAYAAGGAAAISVLTEPSHFDGSLADLVAVRAVTRLPVLRKDFLIHPAQVIEARAHGADAVLLITSALRDDELSQLLAVAGDLGLGVLLETHSDRDLERALATPAPVIGVNARDLETLDVDVEAALGRLRRVPADRIGVLESGIRTRADAAAAEEAGASAILVGETLMRSPDPGATIRSLRGIDEDGASPRDGATPREETTG
jgi:indole-3-glycerol phosphate synthase